MKSKCDHLEIEMVTAISPETHGTYFRDESGMRFFIPLESLSRLWDITKLDLNKRGYNVDELARKEIK